MNLSVATSTSTPLAPQMVPTAVHTFQVLYRASWRQFSLAAPPGFSLITLLSALEQVLRGPGAPGAAAAGTGMLLSFLDPQGTQLPCQSDADLAEALRFAAQAASAAAAAGAPVSMQQQPIKLIVADAPAPLVLQPPPLQAVVLPATPLAATPPPAAAESNSPSPTAGSKRKSDAMQLGDSGAAAPVAAEGEQSEERKENNMKQEPQAEPQQPGSPAAKRARTSPSAELASSPPAVAVKAE